VRSYGDLRAAGSTDPSVLARIDEIDGWISDEARGTGGRRVTGEEALELLSARQVLADRLVANQREHVERARTRGATGRRSARP
jgi:hypothetical protein